MSPVPLEPVLPEPVLPEAVCPIAPATSGRAGFVLLETLVTLALAALLLGMLSRSFLATWHGTAHAREDLQAVMIARSVMESTLPRAQLSPGVRTGSSGGYVWRAQTMLASKRAAEVDVNVPDDKQLDARPANDNRWSLYRIVVTVASPSGRRVALEAFRLGS